MLRTNPPARYPHDLSLDAGKRPSTRTPFGFFPLTRQALAGVLFRQLNSGTFVAEMRRSLERFEGTVNFRALVRRDSFGSVRELDIRPRLALTRPARCVSNEKTVSHYVLAGKHFSRDSWRRQPLIPSVALFKNYDSAAEEVPRITGWPSDGHYEVTPLGYAPVIDRRWCRRLRSDSEDVAICGRAATMRHQSLETAETADQTG
jgi:hypothetical protein